jgi:hypothetical protein
MRKAILGAASALVLASPAVGNFSDAPTRTVAVMSAVESQSQPRQAEVHVAPEQVWERSRVLV